MSVIKMGAGRVEIEARTHIHALREKRRPCFRLKSFHGRVRTFLGAFRCDSERENEEESKKYTEETVSVRRSLLANFILHFFFFCGAVWTLVLKTFWRKFHQWLNKESLCFLVFFHLPSTSKTQNLYNQ